jgi:hypothetical protein
MLLNIWLILFYLLTFYIYLNNNIFNFHDNIIYKMINNFLCYKIDVNILNRKSTYD